MATSENNILIGTAISLICANMLAFAMIIVGVGNLTNCSVSAGIEIYLLGGGVTVVASSIVGVTAQRKINKKYPVILERRWPNFALNISTLLVNLAWSIQGGYSVFSSMVPEFYHKDSPRYCHKDSYFLAMWTCVITWCVSLCLLCFWYRFHQAVIRNEVQFREDELSDMYSSDSDT